ncbi:MAG: cupin domain-containing protein [Pseudomonadota bacterium]
MADEKYLITAEEIAAMEGLAKTHFLNPDAKRINKSLGDLTGLTGLGFHIIEVAPGDETTEYHMHYFEDECIFVLAGTATAEIGEESHPIKPGDFIGYRKCGLAHTIHNTGSETLRMIVVGQRLAQDVGDYPRKAKRIYRNEGLTWNLVDHEHIANPVAGAK